MIFMISIIIVDKKALGEIDSAGAYHVLAKLQHANNYKMHRVSRDVCAFFQQVYKTILVLNVLFIKRQARKLEKESKKICNLGFLTFLV